MNHVLLGACIPFLPILIVYILRKGRASVAMLIGAPLAVAAGVLWASAPDVPRLLGRADLYFRLHSDPRTNIFFWHYTIDQLENCGALSPESPGYTVGVVAIVLCLLLMAWRELHIRENEE